MDAAARPAEPRRQSAEQVDFVNRDTCRTVLATMGLLQSPWLTRAFDTVDREAFVPSAVWLPVRDAEGMWRFIDRDTDPEAWVRAVWDPHRSVVTQLDDGATRPEGPASGDFTSSVSALDVVMRKLQHLDLHEDHQVLEIGYASGYHTALLCERAGSRRVTAVEVDEGLAAAGANHLKASGYAPYLVCGDGLQGVAARAPFDRIISTAALRHVPFAWIEQAAPDAVILTPFGTAYSNAGLLRLEVDGAQARGRFVGESAYMWIRSERPAPVLKLPEECASRPSPIDPGQILGSTHLQDFAIGLQVADVSYSHRGEGRERRVQFVDTAGTSATIVRYGDWWAGDAVRSWGPRDLWAEVTTAYTWYETHGRPDITRFGVTVAPDGQRVWLDDPRHAVGA
ncbi:methyltransferase domain-containing protein [Streptomyces sp. NPDC002054]|uniref:protein-L-isoaspartate O-methyltransferase family protein n=1 Tax=Streptomyces sp. NPDC002054 TaxID=3154663 RepID=UPI003316E938